MKQLVIIAILLMTTTIGCSTMTMDNVKDVSIDKVYNVIFEKKPEMVNKGVYSENLEIGEVLAQQSAANNMGIIKISIKNEYDDLMKSNVVFYISDSQLKRDTIEDTGEPLSDGAKIMGFSGNYSLTLFKTKNKVKDFSNTAINKAKELYNEAVKD
ncbi:hypothetical protein QUF90_15405 [Desulfococcaceae bacterium HSG9]|nr:hypothetical protein [Desulfococcaceae bacterium HSG9]